MAQIQLTWIMAHLHFAVWFGCTKYRPALRLKFTQKQISKTCKKSPGIIFGDALTLNKCCQYYALSCRYFVIFFLRFRELFFYAFTFMAILLMRCVFAIQSTHLSH